MMKGGNVSHPYFPRDLYLPHYEANERSLLELLGVFFSLVFIVLGATWIYTGKVKRMKKKPLLRTKLCWFMACGLIHTILEGYFSLFHKTLAGEQTFLAQLWKEYGKCDSRYVSGDPFAVCMESITAFVDGPLALIAFVMFIERSPQRHIVQLLLSICQLYGDVLYFSTETFEGFKHGDAFHPLYFWFYFVFMNGIWIVVPFACIIESCGYLSNAQAYLDKNSKQNKYR